jgi:hypothetical protein
MESLSLVHSVTFGCNGKLLATAGDKTIVLWKMQSIQNADK